jgi:hypothetical protein
VAYDLVREHFRVLNEIVASEAGAVVKTIGDAVMATFPTPDRTLAATLRMRDSVRQIKNDLLIKIGIHEGPCLAVTLNYRLGYSAGCRARAASGQATASTNSRMRCLGYFLPKMSRKIWKHSVSGAGMIR